MSNFGAAMTEFGFNNDNNFNSGGGVGGFNSGPVGGAVNAATVQQMQQQHQQPQAAQQTPTRQHQPMTGIRMFSFSFLLSLLFV